MWMLAVHFGRSPKNTRDLSVASVSRFSDLLVKFRRFAERFGKFRRCHEVNRNPVWMTAIKVSRNKESIFLKICSHLTVWAWYFRCTKVKTAESYVMSKSSDITNLSLSRKVWVLYVYIWLISVWDSRGNEKSQPRSVSKILTQGYWFSFEFSCCCDSPVTIFTCFYSFLLTPLNYRNKFMHVALIFEDSFSSKRKAHNTGTKTRALSMNKN